MGLSGLVITGFVLVHMLGNLSIFLGPETYNQYSHLIVSNKILLYGTEVILIIALLTHVFMAICLTRENRASRKQKYALPTSGAKAVSRASKSMIYHGTVLLIFIVYHLLTFKFGPYYEVTYEGIVMRDIFRLMVEKFQNIPYVIGYVVCMLTLAFHLSHGVSSSIQSLGFNHPRYTPMVKTIGCCYAIVVALGFMVQPVYIYLAY